MSIQLFKKWTQAVVNSDWDSMSSLYAEDIINFNPDGTTNEGKEAVLCSWSIKNGKIIRIETGATPTSS